jgi:hypothetical protein
MLFKEIIAVYSENHMKPTDTKCISVDCYSRWGTWLPLDFKWLKLHEDKTYVSDIISRIRLSNSLFW